MRPVKLEIEGIKSFTDKVSIDFEKLLSDGLFGIFGDTGSGKSTILDCIVLALYGKIGKNQQKTEFINSKRFKASVEFTFKITVYGERKTYKVRREFSLNQKRESKDVKAYLYEISDDGIILIEEGKSKVDDEIEKIIGIGFDEFQKCIALPQGEFASFVKSARAERLAIVGKLFDLERYGDRLVSKIKKKKDELSVEISGKEEALKNLDVITEEDISAEEKAYIAMENESKSLNEKLLKITEIIDKNKTFYDCELQLKSKTEKLNQLESRKEEYAKKQEDLQLVEDALKISKAIEDYTIKRSSLKLDKNALDNLRQKYDEANVKYSVVAKEYGNLGVLREKMSQNTVLIATINDLQPVITEKKLNEIKIQNLNKSIDEDNKKLSSCQERLNDLLKKKEEKERLYNEVFGNEKFNYFVDALGNGRLKNYLMVQLEKHQNILDNIAKYETNSDLYDYVFKALNEVVSEYKTALNEMSENMPNETENVVERFKEFLEARDNEYKSIFKLSEEVTKIKSQMQILNSELISLTNQSDALAESVNKAEQQIEKKLGKENPESAKSRLLSENEKLKKQEENIEKEYNKLTEQISNGKSEISGLLAKIETSENFLNETEKSIKDEMKGKFDCTADVKEFIKKYGDGVSLKSDVEKYFLDLNVLTASIDDLKKKLSSSDFSLQKYENMVAESAQLRKNQLQIANDLGSLAKKIENNKKIYRNRCLINEILFTKRAEFDKIVVLFNLVKSNKLMEFVADEYLQEIALNAERTLKKLTCGRYGLKYSDNFYVTDNFDGGVERSVSSLSGGETFLVSLSLALSMSQEIYSKSNRPIEFFFLDEGFGTLDDNLVDTVLDSLEKLKNANFTIGIISHVQELKQRINRKINVISATRTSGSQIETSI